MATQSNKKEIKWQQDTGRNFYTGVVGKWPIFFITPTVNDKRNGWLIQSCLPGLGSRAARKYVEIEKAKEHCQKVIDYWLENL